MKKQRNALHRKFCVLKTFSAKNFNCFQWFLENILRRTGGAITNLIKEQNFSRFESHTELMLVDDRTIPISTLLVIDDRFLRFENLESFSLAFQKSEFRTQCHQSMFQTRAEAYKRRSTNWMKSETAANKLDVTRDY